MVLQTAVTAIKGSARGGGREKRALGGRGGEGFSVLAAANGLGGQIGDGRGVVGVRGGGGGGGGRIGDEKRREGKDLRGAGGTNSEKYSVYMGKRDLICK